MKRITLEEYRAKGMTYKDIYNKLWNDYKSQVRKVERQGFELPKSLSRVKNKKPDKKATEGLYKLLSSQKILKESYRVSDDSKKLTRKEYLKMPKPKPKAIKAPVGDVSGLVDKSPEYKAKTKFIWDKVHGALNWAAQLSHMTEKYLNRIKTLVWQGLMSLDEEHIDTVANADKSYWGKYDYESLSSDGVVYHEFLENLEDALSDLANKTIKLTQDELESLSPDQLMAMGMEV